VIASLSSATGAALVVALAVSQPPQMREASHPTGTGIIAGVVMTTDATPRPLRRAIVTVNGAGLPTGRSALTDSAGRFEIDELPAGRFDVTARKAAYLPAAYGAIRPGRPGTPVTLAAGQQLTLRLDMTRGAVLAGTLRDPSGTPVTGVLVYALDLASLDQVGASRTPPNITATDDRGAFRIFSLAPATYVLAAAVHGGNATELRMPSVAEMDALLAAVQRRHGGPVTMPQPGPATQPAPLPEPPRYGYAPEYYPNTPLFADAAHITLAPAEERDGLDMVVTPIRTSTIEGVISGVDPSATRVELSIVIAGPPAPTFAGASPHLTQPPGADGRFAYTDVTPGHVTIVARATPGSAPAAPAGGVGGAGSAGLNPGRGDTTPGAQDMLFASADLDVAGQDISGISLVLQPGAHLSGRVVFDAASHQAPADLTTIAVTLAPPGGTSYSVRNGTIIGNTFQAAQPAAVHADGSFEFSGLAPGTYHINGRLPASTGDAWWLRSAMVNGQDVLDAPFEVALGRDLTGAVLTFTDRHTEISGRLQTASGQPAPQYFIMVFPVDPALWQPGSRRMTTTRPASDGTFSLRDLPAGDYWLAALTDFEPTDWNDPALLTDVATHAVRITLGDGEKKVQNLRIRTAQF
jgi:Carboxypeptidase regulatory-like domain